MMMQPLLTYPCCYLAHGPYPPQALRQGCSAECLIGDCLLPLLVLWEVS